jgi:hypothetical protein
VVEAFTFPGPFPKTLALQSVGATTSGTVTLPYAISAAMFPAAGGRPIGTGFTLVGTCSAAGVPNVTFQSGVPAPATPVATAMAIEYYWAARDHYFISADPAEIAALDASAPGGWARTGQSFGVYAKRTAGDSPVCRYYIPPLYGDSHLFDASPLVCFQAQTLFPMFVYETGNAFSVYLPDQTSGACPTGTAPVYRLWNNRSDTNHRYTTSAALRDQMLAKGYVAEGYGAPAVAMCAPLPGGPIPPTTSDIEGLWKGTTSRNQIIWGLVFADGAYYVLYSQPGTSSVAGVLQGHGAFANGSFSSTDGRDFGLPPTPGVVAASMAGTYTPKGTLQGSISEAAGTSTFSATYDQTSDDPANLAGMAGTFTGSVASSVGVQNAVFVMSASGTFTGNASGCTFSGTALPHDNLNLLDVSIHFNGGSCTFGTSTLSGAAYYSAASKVIYGAAPNASRTDGLLFIGSKP